MGLKPYYMYRQKNMAGHFENVGYCRPGYECLYNVAMMAEVQSVYALGAGGVTKILDGDRIERKFNAKDVETYIGRVVIPS
jgi:oxygen-independent coproporphyrinogen-3 oxidase